MVSKHCSRNVKQHELFSEEYAYRESKCRRCLCSITSPGQAAIGWPPGEPA